MERSSEHQADGGPNDLLESEVSEIWKLVLVVETIQREDHFLDLGGDSLAATLIATRMNDRYSIDVTPGDVYENPTVRHAVELVQKRLMAGG